jgi:hypothetical protein
MQPGTGIEVKKSILAVCSVVFPACSINSPSRRPPFPMTWFTAFGSDRTPDLLADILKAVLITELSS